MLPAASGSLGAMVLESVYPVEVRVIRWMRLSPDVPTKKVELSELNTPLTGAVAEPESFTLLSEPEPAGWYSGRTPPDPEYVINAKAESEVGSTPVMAVGAMPGIAMGVGVAVKMGALPSAGHWPVGRPVCFV